MKTIQPPEPKWLGKPFQCPNPDCGAVVEFEIADLGGIRRIRPRHEDGRWVVNTSCEFCGPVRKFVEVVLE